MKYRNNFGYIFFIILLTLTFLGYINTSLLFMLTIPYLAINIWINSLEEEYEENNKKRITTLAFILALIAGSCFYGQIQSDIRMKQAIKYCYQFSNNSYMCDEMYGILKPQPIE